MCSFQERVESMVMPRYLAEERYSRVALLRPKLGNGLTILDSFWLVPITTTKDF